MGVRDLTCLYCGTDFAAKLSASNIARGEGKYCSVECRNKSHIRKKERTCEICGKSFRIWPSASDGSNGKYCSWNCYSEARRERVELECPVCSKKFTRRPSQASGKRYCSYTCAFKARENEGSYLWHGGKSFEPYCKNFNNRTKAKTRDAFGHRCYLCQKSEKENGKKLDCHHVDYNKSQGCSGRGWGLVPLCVKCHIMTSFQRYYRFALLRDYWIYEQIDFSQKIAGFGTC